MAYAKAGRYDEALLQRQGQGPVKAVTDADVYVFQSDGVTQATIYTDETKAATVAQPLSPDSNGNLEFFAEPAEYTLKVYVDGVLKLTDAIAITPYPDDATSDIASHNADTTLVHGITNTADLATLTGAQQFTGAKGFVEATFKGKPWFDVTHPDFGAVGGGVADDAAAIQAAIDAAEAAGGGIVYFPAGTYRAASQLVVNVGGVWLVGASREATVLSFDLTTLVDGLSWDNPATSGYLYGGGIANLTLKGAADGTSVRDVVTFDDPGNLTLDNVTVRGAARYGIHIDFAINVTLTEVISRNNVSAGLYVGAATSTSTTLRARGCYFHYTTNGPGVDIDSLGAHFEACVFESNGELDATNGVGARIRKGQAGFDNCYWENNAGHDILAGTVAATFVSVVNMHSFTGPYSAAGKAHIFIDQFVKSATILGGKFDTRPESLIIHPSARGVFGHIAASAGNDPIMSDASDVATGAFGVIFGTETSTGEFRSWGRFDPYFRQVRASDHVAIGDGTAALPGLRFVNDADSGIARLSENRWAMFAGGNNILDLNTDRVRGILPFQLPAYTTAQRDALTGIVDGFLILNTSIPAVQARVGGAWVNL